MKKLFMILLSLLIVSIAVIIEGGSLLTLFVPTPLFVMIFGILFSALFSYTFYDIISVFKFAFSEKNNPSKIEEYKKGLLIIENLIRLTFYWSLTTVFLGLVFVLSRPVPPEQLGKYVAIVIMALLYGFGAISILFIPMKSSIESKISKN